MSCTLLLVVYYLFPYRNHLTFFNSSFFNSSLTYRSMMLTLGKTSKFALLALNRIITFI